jgi:hypothetical protein
MTPRDVVVAMLEALNASGIDYIVTGSFATNLYAVPRSTQDVDFVVDAQPDELEALFSRLPKAIRVDPQMRFDTIAYTYRYDLSVEGLPFGVEIFLLTDDEHNRERFRRKRSGTVQGVTAYVPTAEDVIVQKVRWSALGRRAKDIQDVKAIIDAQRGNLDWPYIESWCDRHGTRDLLEKLIVELDQQSGE